MDEKYVAMLFDDVLTAWCNYEAGVSSLEDYEATKADAIQDILRKASGNEQR